MKLVSALPEKGQGLSFIGPGADISGSLHFRWPNHTILHTRMPHCLGPQACPSLLFKIDVQGPPNLAAAAHRAALSLLTLSGGENDIKTWRSR